MALSTGAYHTLALASDGTVWAWGWNGFGQLGDGTTVERHLPVQIPGLSGIRRVAAGAFHSVAVTSPAGTVLTWGLNQVGQLGDGTTVDRHQPTPVPGLVDVREVAAGAYHMIAVYDFRPVMAWGWNALGQLGDGTTVDRHSPVPVAMGDSVQQVAAGPYDSLALTSAGTVKGWGWNDFGQLGDGGKEPAVMAPLAMLGVRNANVISAGGLHSLAG
jgi:alpha-tubulin suppressor-like RCC1 family protein